MPSWFPRWTACRVGWPGSGRICLDMKMVPQARDVAGVERRHWRGSRGSRRSAAGRRRRSRPRRPAGGARGRRRPARRAAARVRRSAIPTPIAASAFDGLASRSASSMTPGHAIVAQRTRRRDGRGDRRAPRARRRRPRRAAGRAATASERHGRDRDRPAEQHEHARGAGQESGAGDVVEVARRQAGVGDPHERRDDAERRPGGQRLGQAGPGGIGVGAHATLRSGSIHSPSRGRSDTRACGTTGRAGSSRSRQRRPSSARTSFASSIAKPTPMHLRVPPPKSG